MAAQGSAGESPADELRTEPIPPLPAPISQPAKPVEEKPVAQRTWSHGGQQAGWRKQKEAVALVPRDLRITDWIAIGAGLAVLAVSFFYYYIHDFDQYFAGSRRASGAWTGWSGIYGEISTVLAAGSSLLLLVSVFVLNKGRSVPMRIAVVLGYALSAVAAIGAYFVIPSFRFTANDSLFPRPVSDGHGYGYWAALLLILAGLVCSWLRLTQVRAAAAEREGAAVQGEAAPSVDAATPRRARHAS
ncbi:hypothetical protein SAMN05892883_1399 [Jatrophihabitans sp. GAS493]|uniref:hypothetical protein n=1 Tax=Jatrophihabitans sp. GAS493 TaxID=1907575 RepID=UPI000BB765F6|nr:hypothetical protein [Jatrophihabitans sp. GAS493]SOD71939.1 hypothetical protein SAMN05892883_1399 [Jatrophihabitans sp. GAS493]